VELDYLPIVKKKIQLQLQIKLPKIVNRDNVLRQHNQEVGVVEIQPIVIKDTGNTNN